MADDELVMQIFRISNVIILIVYTEIHSLRGD